MEAAGPRFALKDAMTTGDELVKLDAAARLWMVQPTESAGAERQQSARCSSTQRKRRQISEGHQLPMLVAVRTIRDTASSKGRWSMRADAIDPKDSRAWICRHARSQGMKSSRSAPRAS
jgi:hypothetical protein